MSLFIQYERPLSCPENSYVPVQSGVMEPETILFFCPVLELELELEPALMLLELLDVLATVEELLELLRLLDEELDELLQNVEISAKSNPVISPPVSVTDILPSPTSAQVLPRRSYTK